MILCLFSFYEAITADVWKSAFFDEIIVTSMIDIYSYLALLSGRSVDHIDTTHGLNISITQDTWV